MQIIPEKTYRQNLRESEEREERDIYVKPDTNEVVNEWLEMYEKYMGKGGEKE